MAEKLTNEQQAAVDSRERSLLVSAAAGSGKTKVLVERLFSYVEREGANLDDFLIITYTRAAASELRGKIAKALTERMAQCAEALFGEKSVYRLREGGMGSEDFASYTYELPCAYLLLGAGTAQEDARYGKPMHNESVVFNENILPRGSALLAYGAMQWLEDRQ